MAMPSAKVFFVHGEHMAAIWPCPHGVHMAMPTPCARGGATRQAFQSRPIPTPPFSHRLASPCWSPAALSALTASRLQPPGAATGRSHGQFVAPLLCPCYDGLGAHRRFTGRPAAQLRPPCHRWRAGPLASGRLRNSTAAASTAALHASPNHSPSPAAPEGPFLPAPLMPGPGQSPTAKPSCACHSPNWPYR